MAKKKSKSPGTLAENRKARHDYNIEDTIEAGIALRGTEIKSIRRGSANLKDSFAQVRRGEMYLNNMHIAPYEEGNRFNHDPLRTRKLLLHKKEIQKLETKTKPNLNDLWSHFFWFTQSKEALEAEKQCVWPEQHQAW